ncbi:MAG: iron ABC transporter permease [Betaproteobacteria bacterium]|nr:iron ABC transporter permease [Betaproteobacteria bacterium]
MTFCPAPADQVQATNRRDSRRAGWIDLRLLAILLALIILAPVLGLAWNAFQSSAADAPALVTTIIPELVGNSVLLAVCVALGVAVIGTLPAWLVAQFEFPGRRVLEWLLVLPLAMPAYVMAYAYADFFQYAGPFQSTLREWFGWQVRSDYWFPDIRTLGGAAGILILALYPYVYVLARVSFLEQPAALMEAGRIAGLGRLAVLWRVAIPVARPAIVAGAALAVMEALADFGTVSYFGVMTLTTGIFKAWFGQGNLPLAAQLGLALLAAAVICLLIEQASRSRAKYHQGLSKAHPRATIHSRKRWVALALCALPCAMGFLVPVLLLLRLALRAQVQPDLAFLSLSIHSFLLALAAAMLTVFCATLMAYAARKGSAPLRWLNRTCGTGYAIPGLVLAVGITLPALLLDRALVNLLEAWTGHAWPLMLSGGVALLVYAYLVRFLGVGLQSVESGLAKITPGIEDAARSLGATGGETLRRVHLPMLRGTLAMATLLVFVDVLKELPATFVLRPFNFDTLAVRVYTLAMDERLGEAAAPALLIVLVAAIPVYITSRAMVRRLHG